jgi:hypothetical protein
LRSEKEARRKTKRDPRLPEHLPVVEEVLVPEETGQKALEGQFIYNFEEGLRHGGAVQCDILVFTAR